MSNGREKLKGAWKFITCRTGEEDSTEEFKRKLTWLCLTVFVFFVAMTVFYFFKGKVNSMTGTMLIAVGAGIICFCCICAENEWAVRAVAGGSVIIVATYLLIQEANRGYGIYWAVVIPVVYLLFFGLLDTLVVGGYFWVLSMLSYLIPMKQSISYYFFWGVRYSFPCLYSVVFFLIIAIGVREKRKIIDIRERENHREAESGSGMEI